MTVRATLVAILLFMLGGTSAWAAPAPIDVTRLERFVCPDAWMLDVSMDNPPTARCGYLNIPERADGSGRKIKLAVVVLTPADAAAAQRAPTVMLHGGPGVGIVGQWWGVATSQVAQAAPLILFDQRGVGMSTPNLCSWFDAEVTTAIQSFKDLLRAQILQCAAKLKKAGVDLADYGTDANVRDMETIRTALGVDKWNVYGFSYGTAVGLAYLAKHAEHTRAAVLDSVYPPEVGAFTNAIPNFLAAIDHMNAACSAQPRCRAHFGDLRTSLHAAIKSLNAAKESSPSLLSASALMGMLQMHMLDIESWQYLPKAIDEAARNKPSMLLLRLMADAGINGEFGVWLATECRERTPFEDRATLESEYARWPDIEHASEDRAWFEACDQWPSKLKQNWATPRDITVPTLVVGGEWDYVTPSRDSQAAAKRLGPRAQFVLASRNAHSSTGSDPCLEGIAVAFLRSPESRLDTRCATNRAPPTFVTELIEPSAAGPIAFWVQTAGITDAETIGWIYIVSAFGVLTILFWPIQALVRRASPDARPPLQRSSFWFVATLLGLAVWLTPLIANLSAHGDNAIYWLTYGLPVEQWPTLAFVLPLPVLFLLGIMTFGDELISRKIGVVATLHRVLVALSLAVVFLTLAVAGLLPPEHVDSVEATSHLWTILSDAALRTLR